jgi:DNA-binding SARP family transcriptional activator/tetratricopeptide (TPR) repeat protein
MSTFYLQLLGGLRLSGPDGEVMAGRRKELALLAYITRRAPRPVSRDELVALLWGDRPEANARHSLRQALLYLKDAAAGLLIIEPEQVWLATGTVTLDVAAFEADLAEGRLDQAVERWGGEFLKGAEDVGGESYRLWVEQEREGLRQRLSVAIERLLTAPGVSAERAVQFAERWAAAMPPDERAQRAVIQALARAERVDEALARHAAFVTRLKQEFELQPSEDFLQFGRELERRARAKRSGRLSPGSTALFTPDLVGRRAALEQLDLAWHAARSGTATVVLVQGEEGIGKTRLCEEFLRVTAERSEAVTILRARAHEATREVRLALGRELLGELRDAPGLVGAPPGALAALATLVPGIRERVRTTSSPTTWVLDEAVAQVLHDVAVELPVILFLDDFPGADGATQDLLLGVAERLRKGRVLMLFTARTDEETPQLVALRALYGIHGVRLQPLDAPSVERALASMLTVVEADRRTLAGRLHKDSGGNPHFVIQLVAALLDEGHLLPDPDGTWRLAPAAATAPLPAPATLRDAVVRRLDQLSPELRAVVEVGAVLAGPADRELLAAVAQIPVEELEPLLEDLLARRVLRLAGPPASGYEFPQDVTRRVVYQAIPKERRQALHRKALALAEKHETAATALAYHRARARGLAPRWRARRWALLSVSVLTAASAGLVSVLKDGGLGRASTTTVAVLPFAVSGNPELAYLAEGLAELLSTNLDGAGGLRTADPHAVRALAGQLPSGPLDPQRGRVVAERAAADLYLLGNIVAAAGRLRVSAALYDRTTPAGPIAGAAVEGTLDSLFQLTDQLARQLLANRPSATEGELTQLAARATPSLPAFKAYLEGERGMRAGHFLSALEAFQRAAAEDTAFALAYYRIAVVASWARDYETAHQAVSHAERHASRLGENQRRLVGGFAAWLAGAADRAEGLYRAVLAVRPTDVEALYQLAEVLYHYNPRRGRPRAEAGSVFRHVLALEPGRGEAALHLLELAAIEGQRRTFDSLYRTSFSAGEIPLPWQALRAFTLGDPDGEARVMAALRRLDDLSLLIAARKVMLFSQNLTGAIRAARLLTDPGRPAEWRALGHVMLAHLELSRGRWQAARAELNAVGAVNPGTALELQALFGALRFVPASREELEETRAALIAWDTSMPRPSQTPGIFFHVHDEVRAQLRAYLLGLLSARLSDQNGLRRYSSELARLPGSDRATALGKSLEGALRVQLLDQAGETEAALRVLESARLEVPFELATNSPFFAQGYERYLRAELLYQLGRDDDALRWYAALAENYPLYDIAYLAPAHLRRGQIYQRLGELNEAARHYARFVELWRDCDPEFHPHLAEAERQLAQLRAAR